MPDMKLARLLLLPDWPEKRLVAELRRYGLKKTRQGTVNRVRNGTRTAGLVLALAIEAVTDGEVKAEELPLSKRTRQAIKRIRSLSQENTAGEAA